MKAISIILLGCLATLAYGYATPAKPVKYADKQFLEAQKAILEVLQHVHQHEVHTTLFEVSKTWSIEENYDHYKNVTAVKEFVEWYHHGLLEFDEVFTVYSPHHLEQVEHVYNIFHYAKDWPTFYKTMVWARFHINEGMFIYALTLAVTHCPYLKGIVLPAPYEIYPHYFFHSDVVQKAQNYKMQGFYGMKKTDEVYQVTIPANYTGWYVHTNPEQKLAYYTEDIGLNSYYYYYHMDYPFWMGGEEYNLFKDRRGEMYFFLHQQLLARYYLERLSNGLGHIPEFSWYKPVVTGYYPNLRYYNGGNFPERDNYHFVHVEGHYQDVWQVIEWEHRIRDAIDKGFAILPDGTHVDLLKPESIEYLGNLVQGNGDSVNPRYYGHYEIIARNLLGNSYEHFDTHKHIPGVLDQYETASRDPMFYQLYKRIVHWYYMFKDHLPSYTVDEIEFPGVEIKNFKITDLVTYFDKFDADITNAVDIEVYEEGVHTEKKPGRIAHYKGEDFLIKARSTRLNHIPFSFKLDVKSEKPQKSVVRVYLGPKYNEYGVVYGVEENRQNFVLLDVFPYELEAGLNHITRESSQFSDFVKDRTTYYELYKWVLKSYDGQDKFPLDMTEAHCGFPERLMLPKGKKSGMAYQFYFIVSPYHAPKNEQYSTYDATYTCGVSSGSRYVDSLPFGYPFDRTVDQKHWYTPNMHYYDVNIFHKTETEVNVPYTH